MRRSKIVCTLGPAVDSYEQLKTLIEAGMNVARLNFSHGTPRRARGPLPPRPQAAAEETGRAVGVLADLQGPKIRLETFAEGPVELVRGDEFTITTEDVPGDKTICGTTYKGLPGDVSQGDPILINDGNVELRVVEVDGPRVRTLVVEGGVISDHKGINLPGAAVNVPALSEKDIDDLRFALRMGCRHGRAVLRARRQGRRRRPPGDGRGGPPGPRHRQGREAAGGREHGGRRHGVRRA